jgi:hypothetical protein
MWVWFVFGCNSEDTVKTFNSNPTIEITSHSGSIEAMEGEALYFRAIAGDANHSASELLVSWFLDDLEVCPEEAPDVSGESICTINPTQDSVVIAQVRDPQDAAARAEVSLSTTSNLTPTADIEAPTDIEILYSDQLITFSGRATDPEDSSTDLLISWESSLEGIIPMSLQANEDGEFSAGAYLGEGEHFLSLHVEDTNGKTDTDTVTVRVGGPNESPSCTILTPVMGEVFVEGESILLSADVSDAETDSTGLLVSWSSDKDGLLNTSTPSSSGEVLFATNVLSVDTHTITLSVEDDAGSLCNALLLLSIGTAPEVSILSPSSGTVFSQGESIVFEGEILDGQDIASQLDVAWESTIDGLFSTDPPLSNGSVIISTASLSPGTHSITLSATDSSGLIGQDLLNMRINRPPIDTSVTIAPTGAQTQDDIYAQALATDEDGDSIQYSYSWLKNGVGTSYSSDVIPHSATSKGENWTVEVIPSDGYATGISASASIIIQNTAPILSALSITPSTPSNSDTLTCTATSTDPDEVPTESISWNRPSDGLMLGTGGSLILDPNIVHGGDILQCIMTSTDSDGASDTLSGTISIQNSAPIPSLVTITPSSPNNSDTVFCSVVATDPDGDAYTSDFSWTHGGTGIVIGSGATLSLSSSLISALESLICTATVTDSSGASASLSQSIVLTNRTPVVGALSITPSVAYNTDTLLCAGTTSDPDGDGYIAQYTWIHDGSGVTLGISSSLTLSSSMAMPSDSISCTLTVTDSHGAVGSDTASITLGNQPPTLSSIAFSPTAIDSNTAVTCIPQGAADPDGQVVSFVYSWYREGILDPESSDTLSPPHQSNTILTCTVTPSDGSLFGAPVSGYISISNAPPSISALAITPNPLYTAETASLSISASDADGDAISFLYDWSVNGVSTSTSDTLDSSHFVRGDSIEASVTPFDGFGSGSTVIDTLIVSNSLPTSPSVSLPSNPREGVDDLECSIDTPSTDADGDTISYTFSWTVNGTPYSGATQTAVWTGDVVSATNTSAGEVWVCTVVPNDGFIDGAAGSSTTTIKNADTRVFVTGSSWSGDLGGLSGADDKCQQSADDAGLGGTWTAFLSNGTSASSRIAGGPYVRLDGAVIAQDKSDLLDGSIAVTISIDEYGSSRSGFVFTGSNASGSSHGSSTNGLCVGWTRGCGACFGNHFYAQVGRADRSNDDWVDTGWVFCSNGGGLYCFED